jgi:hypothetical protein
MRGEYCVEVLRIAKVLQGQGVTERTEKLKVLQVVDSGDGEDGI